MKWRVIAVAALLLAACGDDGGRADPLVPVDAARVDLDAVVHGLQDAGYDVRTVELDDEVADSTFDPEPLDIATIELSGGNMPFDRALTLFMYIDAAEARAGEDDVQHQVGDEGAAGGRFATRNGNVVALVGGTTQGDAAASAAFRGLPIG